MERSGTSEAGHPPAAEFPDVPPPVLRKSLLSLYSGLHLPVDSAKLNFRRDVGDKIRRGGHLVG